MKDAILVNLPGRTISVPWIHTLKLLRCRKRSVYVTGKIIFDRILKLLFTLKENINMLDRLIKEISDDI